ncbi:MAG TPA: CPBP family intramembrane glutamic endopeptidase [Anaerolineales bacterium]|nr:CPBP family intramembrane glutamic endopeptidase [Anaerolineales bacterium]
MKTIAARVPVLFALVTALVAMLCLSWPLAFTSWSIVTQAIIGRVGICIFAIAMLSALGWWGETGFVRPKSWRILLPYLPLFLLILVSKISEINSLGIHISDLNFILIGIFVYLAGGFMEEAVFRGLVLRTLLPQGLVRAAILSSLIFAVVHFLNLAGGANFTATVLQVVVAFLMGLAFVAPLAVTRNIWPLVIIHSLYNFIGYLTVGGILNTSSTSQSPTLSQAVNALIIPLILAIFSIWLLVRTQRKNRLGQVTVERSFADERGAEANTSTQHV